ncbi:cop9 complex subunit 7a [Thraustotheca clavata]|uniref:Cop9 complex subunit 7a n=1 Tax=Thraustotheca clavata TaxID=74557 RepID=A0A1V9ZQD7_9STRA|nr:cop9 complex subunit 7a [Thraustotheca clavata]
MVATDDGSLEQFTLLAKTARGRACVALIQQVLTNKKIFVFGELLHMPNVVAMTTSDQPEQQSHYRLLNVFAYGRFKDYLREKAAGTVPQLTPEQELKLRKLTVVSLCQEFKQVPYKVLMEELQISGVRDVEDIVIETMYSGLVDGKLDQKNEYFDANYAVGRDVRVEDIDTMINFIQDWQKNATHVVTEIDNILGRATTQFEDDAKLENSLMTAVQEARSKISRDRSEFDSDAMFTDTFGGIQRSSSGKRRMQPGTSRKISRV